MAFGFAKVLKRISHLHFDFQFSNNDIISEYDKSCVLLSSIKNEYSGALEALVRRIEQHHSGIREAPLKQLNYYSWYPGMLVKALPS